MTNKQLLGPALRPLQRLLTIAVSGFNLWLERNAFMQAGALAFFTIFSLAPTLIIAATEKRPRQ